MYLIANDSIQMIKFSNVILISNLILTKKREIDFFNWLNQLDYVIGKLKKLRSELLRVRSKN
ncbi:hypothetical protein PybrP1_004907 [[Pythium] brassicae (nom. inval.)]|nr:hypothetical protein PybrP1_004907 [[Pythium] brassicae (nom. inval.)]